MKAGMVQELASSLDLHAVGITRGEPSALLQERLKQRAAGGRRTTFEEQNIDARQNTQALLPGCQSIIVMALPYHIPERHYKPEASGPRGQVARCAQGRDYHLLALDKAEKLAHLLQKLSAKRISYRLLCDRNPLVERELAVSAGLGTTGDNCMLINPLYGSYTVLATILTTLDLDADKPAKQACTHCGQCRRACPTEALRAPGILDPRRCLSYLSQASGSFPREWRSALGQRLYGCDSCQEACPANTGVLPSPFRDGAFTYFPPAPPLDQFLLMSGREFQASVGLTAAGWRGKTTLQRNAVIALGNTEDPAALSLLARLLENDPRTVIRMHAAWALGRTRSIQARRCLERAWKSDGEESVREEAALALEDWAEC